MTRIWGWIVRWWRGTDTSDSLATEQARKRLDQVRRDDVRVDRLGARVERVQRENNLGPAISRALRARQP